MDKKQTKQIRREDCPMMKAASLLGDRWALMIIRECFFGFRRFDEFKDNLKVSKSVLSTKLRYLVERGILAKSPYREGKQRERYEYVLTQKGKDLYKILIGLIEWSNTYLVEEGALTVRFVDRTEEHPTSLSVTTEDGKMLGRRDIEMEICRNQAKAKQVSPTAQ